MQIKNRQDFNSCTSMKIYKNGRTGKFVKTCPKIALKHICIYTYIFLETLHRS